MSKIKEARNKLGISQRELSVRLGIPVRTIEDWERGARTPSPWMERMIVERIEDLSMDIIIKRRYNEDFNQPEYNCGLGWRASLLGAMEEAGVPIETKPLSSFLHSVAIARGLDEYRAKQLAKEVEDFFGVLMVPADLNPRHHE